MKKKTSTKQKSSNGIKPIVIKSVCEHETVVLKNKKGWVCCRCGDIVNDQQTVL